MDLLPTRYIYTPSRIPLSKFRKFELTSFLKRRRTKKKFPGSFFSFYFLFNFFYEIRVYSLFLFMLYFSYQFELLLVCISIFLLQFMKLGFSGLRIFFHCSFSDSIQLLFNYIWYWQFTLNIAIIKLFLLLFDFSSLVYAIVLLFLA